MIENISEDMSYKMAISILDNLETVTNQMDNSGEELPSRDDIVAGLISAAVSLAYEDEDIHEWVSYIRGMFDAVMNDADFEVVGTLQ